MLNCSSFFESLEKNGVGFYAGVPDSLLKDICAYITDNVDQARHLITPNEGNAVALAAGHYLKTSRMGLIYMQNSGLGNVVNPVTSLADSDVYGIPMLLLVGWRGEPGTKDEPQHVKMGKVTLTLLEALGILYLILPAQEAEAAKAVETAVSTATRLKKPFALVVRAGTFEPYKLKKEFDYSAFLLVREDVIASIAGVLPRNAAIVSTTGHISRELYEKNAASNNSNAFYNVGAMGHASHIALGVALQDPQRPVYCFDGDGAVLMHMGALASLGQFAPQNFKHIILNNGAHISVGGQPTVGFSVRIAEIARASGYRHVWSVADAAALDRALGEFVNCEGPALLEVRVNERFRKDLGRPKTTPAQNKEAFMSFLQG